MNNKSNNPILSLDRHRGCRLSLLQLWVVAAWCGTVGFVYGQSDDSPKRLRVPVRSLESEPSNSQMLEGLPGFYSFGSQIDPLSYYQRSRLGRWIVDREVDPEDSVIGIELVTPAGPVRIRYEVTLAGQPFRAVREQMIDELMALAKEPVDKEKVVAEEAVEEEVVEEEVVEEEVVDNPPDPQPEKVAKEEAGDTDGVAKDKEEVAKEAADDAQEVASDKEDDAEENPSEETEGDDPPEQAEEEVELTNAEVYTAATQNDRLAAYARSRGERLKKHELRRRAADVAGGPALLWTSPDVAADREETATLFAFLDADEDGVISSRERSTAVETLEDQDVNADGRIGFNELNSALKQRSPRRQVSTKQFSWRSWDAVESEDIESLAVEVSFAKEEGESNLAINNYRLVEPWSQHKAEIYQGSTEQSVGEAVLLSHPKIEIALTAVVSVPYAVEKEGPVVPKKDDPDKADSVKADQVSIGVVMEGNPLHRQLDRNSDGYLSGLEIRKCGELIKSLDSNADGSLALEELPVLLRVCVAQGPFAHKALAAKVTVIKSSGNDDGNNLVAPEWFVSMDKDGDRTLTRKEFLGGRTSFKKMDTDKNDLLSLAEVLAANPKE